MRMRDGALVERAREAETMVLKLEQACRAAELRAEQAERRTANARETLTNVNHHLKTAIGPSNKWRYRQYGFLSSGSPPEEAHAHLSVLEDILSAPSSGTCSSQHAPSHDSDITGLSHGIDPEARIADLSRRLLNMTTAKAIVEKELQHLTEHVPSHIRGR
jgi:hypothetical protein